MKIVALGGNAISEKGRVELEDQRKVTALSMKTLALLLSGQWASEPLIITHGNGPVVGAIMIKSEALKESIAPLPLYVADADSEGEIGFILQQGLYNELKLARVAREVVSLITQVVVDENDPGFVEPTKPIGPYYTPQEAQAVGSERLWVMREQGADGFRRVVASPKPVRVVESGIIERLANSGVIVIAAGGGGVPVIEGRDGALRGVDAVIDKDSVTALLGAELGADTLVILTAIDRVYLDFDGPARRGLTKINTRQALKYLSEGHFAPGSMGPKVESAVEFLRAGGGEVLITSPELFEEALLKHRGGTRITL